MKIEEELDGRFRNDYHKGFINLLYTAKQLEYDFIHELKEYDLTEQQYNILKILRGFGNKPRKIEFLRERMLDKKSDISRIVERLYQKGFIGRCDSNKDRRQKEITITEKGLNILSNMDECEQKIDNLLHNLSSKEVDQLNDLLNKIRE